jgi:hypothetical protein
MLLVSKNDGLKLRCEIFAPKTKGPLRVCKRALVEKVCARAYCLRP